MQDLDLKNDHVLKALEYIRKSYLAIKNVIATKDKELKILQDRNQKLSKAVNLLQREKYSVSEQSPKKKPKAKRPNVDESYSSIVHDETISDLDTFIVNADETDDDLNVALNSEEILKCSLNETTQVSPMRSESISETENVKSLRMLHTSFERRKIKNMRINNAENTDPLGSLKRNESVWLSKERDNGIARNTKLEGVRSDISADSNGSFTKPQTGVIKSNQMTNTFLEKPKKLKQSRLQLNLSRKKIKPGSDSLCEKTTAGSPNLDGLLQPSKSTSSWLLRVNNTKDDLASKRESQRNETLRDKPSVRMESDVVDDFENVFNFTMKSISPQNNTPIKATSPDKLTILEAKKEDTHRNSECDPNCPSVMILTPSTPDIIFVDDDSFNCTTTIESMDLLEDVLKSNSESLDNLKRIEIENINKLQKIGSMASKTNSGFKSNMAQAAQYHHCKKENVTQEPLHEKLKTRENNKNVIGGSSHEFDDFNQRPIKLEDQRNLNKIPTIRAETASEHTQGNKLLELKQNENEKPAVNKNLFKQINNDLEDIMPQPFEVKVENHASNPKPFNLKEKLNIDCRDCQQYINFFGNRMTNEEINQHLKRCMRHKAPEENITSTPDGFWDPFIISFDENDPRNETLVDDRFLNQEL